MNEKRKYWLKIEEGLFADVLIRAMQRKCGPGAVYVYLRMMVASLKSDCTMFFMGTEETFAEEIAVNIGMETQEGVNLVQIALDFGKKYGLIEERDENTIAFLQALELSGGETMAAARMRRFRAKPEEGENAECNNVTQERNESGDVLRSDVTTLLYKNKSKSRDKEELKNSKSKVKEDRDVTSPTGRDVTSPYLLKGEESQTAGRALEGGPPSGPFTLSECRETAQAGKVPITEKGLEEFYNRNEDAGWTINGKPVKNLLLALRGFLKNFPQYRQQDTSAEPEAKQGEQTATTKPAADPARPQKRTAAEIEQSIIKKGAENMPETVREYVSRQDHEYQLRAAVWYCHAGEFLGDEQDHIKKVLGMKVRSKPTTDSKAKEYLAERQQCLKKALRAEWDRMTEEQRLRKAAEVRKKWGLSWASTEENNKKGADALAVKYDLDEKDAAYWIQAAKEWQAQQWPSL